MKRPLLATALAILCFSVVARPSGDAVRAEVSQGNRSGVEKTVCEDSGHGDLEVGSSCDGGEW